MGNKSSTKSHNDYPPPAAAAASPETDSPESSTFTCEICIEPFPSRQIFRNERLCVHPFCVECVIKYIQVMVEDNRVADVKCPGLDCDNFLDPIWCRPSIGNQLFDKWCDVLCDRALLGLDRCYCPNRACSALVVNECGGNVKKSICPNCKRLFCFRCKISWHAGYRCEESGETRDQNDIEFGVLAERNKLMRCPQCDHYIELSEGCSIVKCRCGSSFCYKCGRKVHQHWCNCRRCWWWCNFLFDICIIVFFILVFPLYVNYR